MKEVEYRVRPVTRYNVTRWYSVNDGATSGGGCETLGEFDREDTAIRVMEGMAAIEVGPAPTTCPLAEDGKSIRWTWDHEPPRS